MERLEWLPRVALVGTPVAFICCSYLRLFAMESPPLPGKGRKKLLLRPFYLYAG